MNEQEEMADLAAAVKVSDAKGPIVLEMDTGSLVKLIAVIQLASRHPGTRKMEAMRQMIELARRGQAGLAARDERLGRYLERGWDPSWDVRREG